MALDCPKILQITRWDNSGIYGDENAQSRILNLISKENAVFISGHIIRRYEYTHSCKVLSGYEPIIHATRYEAYAIPKCFAINMLKEFDPGESGCLILRDLNYLSEDTKQHWHFHTHKITDEHLVLDFDFDDSMRVRQPRVKIIDGIIDDINKLKSDIKYHKKCIKLNTEKLKKLRQKKR